MAHWRLLSSVIIGVLLASAIMAGTVIYFDSLREVALKHALTQRTATELDILTTAEKRPTSHEEYQRVSSVTERQVDLRLAWLLQDRIRVGKTATFYFATPGKEELAGKDDKRAYFAFAPRLQQHMTLLPGGRLPREQPLNPPGEPLELEAIVPVEAAQLLEVGVGDSLSLVPYWEDAMPYARVVISGVFQRDDPENEFWYLYKRALQAGTTLTVRAVPLFISEETYLGMMGPAFSNVESTYAWLLDVDTERLNAGNSAQALSDIELTQRWVGAALNDYRQSTALFGVLKEYDQRLFFTKVPMLVFLILIAVVILYYVVTLSSLVVERQRSEVALLRSRGASSGQILAVFVLEGATISVLAALAGPLLAAIGISVLGFTPAFSDLSGNARLPVSISTGAYMMSALGGLLSFVALMVPAVQASRIGVTGHRQQTTRPSRLPAFQRYYLDVLLLIVSIVLFRQLTQQGSVLATGLLGEVAVNQLLLAIPALMLVAAAMILLRLFPLVMNLSSRLLSRWLPAGLVLGLWQMARNPTHYARLSLLLILTAGLGIFAASLVGTLELSFNERVLYSTGSDIRLEGVELNNRGISSNLVERYERSSAIDVASPVFRGRGFDSTKPRSGSFTMLAVNEDSLRKVARFRDDFSKMPMEALLKSLRPSSPPEGIELPPRAGVIEVLLKANRPERDVRVYARIKDANDRYASYSLGRLGETDPLGNVKKADWGRLRASLLDSELLPVDPLTLVSLGVHATHRAGRLRRGSILMDQITVGTLQPGQEPSDPAIETEIIEPFDDATGWSVLQLIPDTLSDDLREADASFNGDSGSVMFTWSDGQPMTSRGIFYGPQMSPLPVLASKSFIKDTGYPLGEEIGVSLGGHQIPVRLVDTIDFFPTLDPFRERFLIADLESLVRYANLDPLSNEFQPNEVWLSIEADDIDGASLVQSLAREPFPSQFVNDRAKRLADFQVDPLAKAGWSALLFIAFSTVLILSCVGFVVHSYVSFREREWQFALLRTVGISMKQLTTLVLLEQVLVIAAGMALGSWTGGRLVGIIMPFLGHDDRGGPVVPPFAMEVNWALLLITYAVMASVFAVIITGVIWFIRRTSLQRIMRIGDM